MSAVNHARGFPSFGPPTMCGEGTPPDEPCYEVTCPGCLAVGESAESLAARIAELEAAGVRSTIGQGLVRLKVLKGGRS